MHRYGRIFGMIQVSFLAALDRAYNSNSGVLVSIVVRRLFRLFRPLFILTEYICLSRRRPGYRSRDLVFNSLTGSSLFAFFGVFAAC